MTPDSSCQDKFHTMCVTEWQQCCQFCVKSSKFILNPYYHFGLNENHSIKSKDFFIETNN